MAVRRALRRTIERVDLTNTGGIPLVHLTRDAAARTDSDLIASMFMAIQSFMDDSFREMGIGDVRSIEMGDRPHVAFGRRQTVLLCVLYRGRESNRLERRVEHVVRDIEDRFGLLLRSWDRDMDRVASLRNRLSEEFDLRSVDRSTTAC